MAGRINLTPKQLKFARLYFETGNANKAYRATYSVENMRDSSIAGASSELLQNPSVVSYVDSLREDAAYVAQLNVAWVLKQYMQIATADVNELIEARNVNCRYCHGTDHNYQWLDVEEWANAINETLAFNARQEATEPRRRQPPLDIPSDAGGFGFWGTKAPHPECPKCFGKGTLDVHVHDTRKLKGPARLLYDGVKTTANGIEVKVRDRDAALAFLAKFLKLGEGDRPPLIPNGEPAEKLVEAVSDPVEVSKVYAQIMGGAPSV